MSKKIRFPLLMKSNIPVRTIEELRENFDLLKTAEYFLNGKLEVWLAHRYYEEALEAVKAIDKNYPDFYKKLCVALGVEYVEPSDLFDMDFLQDRTCRLNTLKQYTSDQSILGKIDSVAFNQEELGHLLDKGIRDIYLCSNIFHIPLLVYDKKYIGIGRVTVVIHSKYVVDFWVKRIEFVNVEFDAEYKKFTMHPQSNCIIWD